MSWVRTTKVDDLQPGHTRVIDVHGESLLLCRTTDDEVHAVENCCSHDDGPLGQGTLDGTVIQCPRHGARFDVTTGAVLRMPAAAPIESFPVRIDDEGWIEVDAEDE